LHRRSPASETTKKIHCETSWFQVLIIYLIIGLILWLPPIFLPQWKKLVIYLNRREIINKKRIEIFLTIICIPIIITAIVLISLFNQNMFRFVFGGNEELEAQFFGIFAGFTFILMPISMAIIAIIAYIHNTESPKLGYIFILLFAFGAIAMAGSFYHDFLWCGTATEWYTVENLGGYDFDMWTWLLHIESRDYRLLGISQGILAIILVIYSFILLWRFNSFIDMKLKGH